MANKAGSWAGEYMKIFISWSKDQSRVVAAVLKNWLPRVIQSCEPWMSDTDVLAGQRWGAELTQRLDESKIGILCVTPENYREPWLNFEAGVISRKVGTNSQSHMAPYLLGFERPEDLPPPLGQFQAKVANKEGTFDLLQMINSVSDKPLTNENLREQFEMLWPKLEEELQKVSKTLGGAPAKRRPDGEKLDELLSLTRTLLGRLKDQPLYGMGETFYTETAESELGEGSGRARSSTEHFLYAVLEQRAATRGLFTLNEQVKFGDKERPVEVDLLCRELKVAVEIDGHFHFRDFNGFRRDRRKDVLLQRAGYLVVHFLAQDVVARLEEIIDTIDSLIDIRRP